MKHFMLIAFCLGIGAHAAHAQGVHGYVGGGTSASVDHEWYGTVGGGLTIEPGGPWIDLGVQGEALVALPYFAGRGAVFGQVNVAPRSAIRPFVMGGAGFGEDSGPLVGGGVEIRPAGSRYGARLAIEDYLARYQAYTFSGDTVGPPVARNGHQVAVRVSVLF